MFPRANRLHRSQDILAVFRTGERFRRGPVTLFYLPGSEVRVAVVTDKKVSKHAVVRNLLKRRLRACLQALALPAGSYVLRAYPGAETKSFAELQALVQQCLPRA